MKKIKIILFSAMLMSVFNTFSQKVKYNEIKPLLESKQDENALPILVKYYNQNIVDGKWSSKAILMEMDNMFSASENLARIYENKANIAKSAIFADSSILWFNAMIKDDHPQKNTAEQKIQIIEKNKKNWQEEEISNQKRHNQVKLDSITKIKNDSITANLKLKQEEQEKIQIKCRELNTGVNDPMIVAKKYTEAFIKGDMETLIKLGYIDTISGRTGILKAKTIAAYKADKTKFTFEIWKDEVLKSMINPRISKDYYISDYKKKNVCGQYDDEFDDISKPLMIVKYENESEVTIQNILTYDYNDKSCKSLGNDKYEAGITIHHMHIELIKYKGKWLVSRGLR